MKKLFKIFLISVAIFTTTTLIAQNPSDPASEHKAYKRGERLFKNGNYVKAGDQFQMLLDSGYRDNNLITYQAQVYLELHEPHTAKDVIMLSEKRNQDLDYLLAIAHYYLEEFEDAKRELDLVTDTATYRVGTLLQRIRNSTQHYYEAEGYVVQNFGPEVNTKYREYAAVMYDDFNELLYTSRNDSSEFAAHDGLAYETIHGTSIDSLNNWHVADRFDFHMGHEKRHDATVQVYQHGKKLVTYHDGRLHTSHMFYDTWEEDGPLDIHGFDGVDTHCFISDDESFVIFASDFHADGHNLDLYVSYKQENGKWGEPQSLTELNTIYDEDAPFLAGDSTLYFSSRGHGSLGGYDVFKTTYDKKRKRWSEPVNLDFPVNTVAEDIYYTTYGKVGYVSSTRNGGYGSLDLYRVLLFNKVMIQGKVINDKTDEVVPFAQIELAYDSLYFRSYSDSAGRYEMFVPINKNMKVTILKDKDKLHEGTYYADAFFRKETDRDYNFHIPWRAPGPDKVGFIHIDVMNTFEDDPYIMAVANDEVSDWSDSLKNHYEQQRIANYVPGPGMITVYLEHNSSELSTSAKDVLKELYQDVLEGRKYTVEIGGHTDATGSAEYNKRLSLTRAEVVAQYLTELGLKQKKEKVVGYGEERLIDESSSPEAHAKNRRVEINFY